MIYDLARDTYKAIYGKDPEYTPYYEASHTPFKGMDVNLVKSLVNETQVNKFLRQWRKENTPSEISIYNFVSERNYVVGIFKEHLYAVQDIETGKLRYQNLLTSKVTIPAPGFADTLKEGVLRTISQLHLYTEHTSVEHVSGKATGFISGPFRVDTSTEMFANSVATGCVSWVSKADNCTFPDYQIVPIHKINIL